METGAQAAALKNRFDQADRDRIRRALLRYCQEHAIGVPTLQKEIAAANDLSLDRVPLKTLQRFLGNTHRSNEAMVRFCDRFVGNTAGTDPITALGEQVAAFLGVWRSGHDCRPVPPMLAGSFAGRTKSALEPGQTMRILSKDRPSPSVPFSQVTIEQLPGRAFASVRETISNWNRQVPNTAIDAARDDAETQPRRAYEGIVLHPNGALFVLMRNILTGTPRLYWLGQYAGNRLIGYGHESLGSLDGRPEVGDALHSTTEIVLDPMEDGDQ
jgi:hypothetical protein